MAQKIRFTKMHGCGNDYIYINMMEQQVPNPQEAAIRWSDRHKGIGSDGLVLIGASPVPEADFSMHIYNADGSEAMMCGNASRCIGKYLYERGLTDKEEIRLLTLSGVKTLQLHVSNSIVESVTVDMGEPVFEDENLFLVNRGVDKVPSCRWAIRTTSSLLTMWTRWPRKAVLWSVILPSHNAVTLSLRMWRRTVLSVLVSGNVVAASPKPVVQVLVLPPLLLL